MKYSTILNALERANRRYAMLLVQEEEDARYRNKMCDAFQVANIRQRQAARFREELERRLKNSCNADICREFERIGG